MNPFIMYKNRKMILGMNERNLAYIKRYTSSKSKRNADDKLRSKKILEEAGIKTPKFLGKIETYQELYEFDWDSLPKSFVIKPVGGLEGGGIEIFFNRNKYGEWIKADGSKYSIEDIKTHASDIIDGKYALHNQPDKVFFEERVKMHKAFQYYAHKGVPDIRVVIFNSIPVMGMLRLPTKESDGKGNLQMGAIGSGIDISTGVTTTAIIGKGKLIETIPNSNLNISGLKIPYWNKILEMAVKATEAMDLKYAGVDFLIDRVKGPMVIEVNARPGLSIQIANKDGLRWRMRKARGIKVTSSVKGVRLGKDLFGGAIEDDIERISGKSLIGIYENIYLHNIENISEESDQNANLSISTLNKNTKGIKTKAKIDTGADSTSIDKSLAIKLGYQEYIDEFEKIRAVAEKEFAEETGTTKYKKIEQFINERLEEVELPLPMQADSVHSSHGSSVRQYITIQITLGDLTYTTKANIYDRSKMKYQVIVGRKSLSKFLVEPAKPL